MKSGLKFNPGLALISLQTTGIRSATLNGWQGPIQDWTTHNPRPLYHLRHHQISYYKCVHAAIVPLFAPVPERGRSMELHITFQSCQSIWLIISSIFNKNERIRYEQIDNLYFYHQCYLHLFSFDRCRDDCAKREKRCILQVRQDSGVEGQGGEHQRSSIWGGLTRGPIP